LEKGEKHQGTQQKEEKEKKNKEREREIASMRENEGKN